MGWVTVTVLQHVLQGGAKSPVPGGTGRNCFVKKQGTFNFSVFSKFKSIVPADDLQENQFACT